MSSKSFVKLLRKIIREEVQDAVRTVLTEQTVNHNQIIEHGMNLSHVADSPKPIFVTKLTLGVAVSPFLYHTLAVQGYAQLSI